jgi:hypothetical protein
MRISMNIVPAALALLAAACSGVSQPEGDAVCTSFLEEADGVCSRSPFDPCISQDPDCSPGAASCEAGGQSFPSGSEVPSGDSCNSCNCNDGTLACTRALCEPEVCAAFIEAPDGVCSRFPLDPCISQDPDCSPGAASCEAGGQSFPSGSEVPSGDSCNSCSCNDGTVACTLALCAPMACAAFIEAPDGSCARFPLDPCIAQDPDCAPPEPTPN